MENKIEETDDMYMDKQPPVHLTCIICREIRNDNLNLPCCNHPICEECLNSLKSYGHDKCPACRADICVDSIRQLLNSVKDNKIMNEKQFSQQLEKAKCEIEALIIELRQMENKLETEEKIRDRCESQLERKLRKCKELATKCDQQLKENDRLEIAVNEERRSNKDLKSVAALGVVLVVMTAIPFVCAYIYFSDQHLKIDIKDNSIAEMEQKLIMKEELINSLDRKQDTLTGTLNALEEEHKKMDDINKLLTEEKSTLSDTLNHAKVKIAKNEESIETMQKERETLLSTIHTLNKENEKSNEWNWPYIAIIICNGIAVLFFVFRK